MVQFWDFAFQRGWCGFDPWSGSWNPTWLGAIEAKHKQRQYCGKFNEEFFFFFFKGHFNLQEEKSVL